MKVKLSQYLTKYHAIKMYNISCLINYHAFKTYWGSGGTSRILNLGTRWRWVASFMTRRLYSRGKNRRYPFVKRLGWPQSWSTHGGEKKKKSHHCLCWKSNLGHPARSLVTILTEKLQFLLYIYIKWFLDSFMIFFLLQNLQIKRRMIWDDHKWWMCMDTEGEGRLDRTIHTSILHSQKLRFHYISLNVG